MGGVRSPEVDPVNSTPWRGVAAGWKRTAGLKQAIQRCERRTEK